jgi:hypothetical protein
VARPDDDSKTGSSADCLKLPICITVEPCNGEELRKRQFFPKLACQILHKNLHKYKIDEIG